MLFVSNSGEISSETVEQIVSESFIFLVEANRLSMRNSHIERIDFEDLFVFFLEQHGVDFQIKAYWRTWELCFKGRRVAGYYLHERYLHYIEITMFSLKKVYTSIAASKMAFRTSARLSSSRMEVARAEME